MDSMVSPMTDRSETAAKKRPIITPSVLRDHAENLSPSGTYWVCEVLEKAAMEIERLRTQLRTVTNGK